MIGTFKHFAAGLAMVLATGATLVQPAAAEDKKEIVIGVSVDSGAAVFRKIELMGLYDAAKEAGNVKIIELNADNNTTTQFAQIKSLVDQKVDVLVACAIDKDAVLTAFDYAQDHNVPIIAFDRKVDHPQVFYSVVYDSFSDAQQLAKFIVSKDDGKPHTVFLTVGSLTDPNGIARRDGFYDVVKSHPNLKVVEILTDWDVNKALSNTQNALQLHPDVWAAANVSAHMTGSIMRALDEAGRKKKVGEDGHVIYVDLSGDPPSMDYLREGYTDASFIIPAEKAGKAIFDAAMLLANGKKPAETVFNLPTWPLLPSEYEAKRDQVWSIKFADLFK